MRGKAHLTISAFLVQTVAILVYKDLTPVPMIIGGVASLLPDIDTDQSKISYAIINLPRTIITLPRTIIRFLNGKKNTRKRTTNNLRQKNLLKKYSREISIFRKSILSLLLIAFAFLILYLKLSNYFIPAIVYTAILPWTTHRGISHTLLSTSIIGGFAILGFNKYGLSHIGVYILLGYLCHLLEDTLTVTGIAYLHPFSKKRIKFKLMSTSTPAGNRFEFFIGVLAFLLCLIVYATHVNLIAH